MNIKESSTLWVLFLSSSEPEPEVRHVLDLAFGLLCLERGGISPSNICIYVDSPNTRAQLFNFATTNIYNVKSTDQFFSDVNTFTHENMVMFVTGHGSPHGIDAITPITPAKLVNTLKSMDN